MLYKNEEELKCYYDIIIVGGGLSGLTAANVLSKKFKYKILLLEQNSKIGGLASWFKRKGHVFNISLHGFPFGMIKTCKKYWSDKIAEKIIQIKNIKFENPQFSFTTTFDINDFTDKLINFFKIPNSVVLKFFDAIQKMEFFEDSTLTTRDFLDSFFHNRNDVIRFLMEPITYANGSTLDDPALTYGIVFSNFMNKGIFTFNCGIDTLIEEMQNELLQNQVDIGINCFVDKILIENKKVLGCIVKNKVIKCKSVISNCNLIKTIKNLVGKDYFSQTYINKFNKIRLNNSSAQVYIGLKKGEDINENIPELIFISDEPLFNTENILQQNTKSRSFSLYSPLKMNNLKKYSIVASTNARYEDWANLNSDQYLNAKKELIKSTIESLEKIIPNVKNKIEYLEVATPKTFEKFTLHENGASFGTKFEGLKFSMNLNKQIKGLFHTGSVGIIMSGWLGTVNYGVITANNVDKLLKG